MPTAIAERAKSITHKGKKLVDAIRLFAEVDTSGVTPPDEIQVIPTGEWHHPLWGAMKITARDIGEFAENFKKGVRKDIRITAGHDGFEEKPAIAWIKGVTDKGKDGLWAAVEWTPEGVKLLTEGSFKYFSPEYFPTYEDPKTRKVFNNVLVGGALTNNPFFKELKDVVTFSEPKLINLFSENDMTIEEILKKAAADRTTEEVAFLEENKDDLSDEQSKQLEDEAGADDGDGGGDGGADDGGSDDGGGDGGGADDGGDGGGDGGSDDGGKNDASETGKGKVTMSAAEAHALTENANKGAKAFAELDKMKVTSMTEKMTFSESNAKGRFGPKQTGAVEALLVTMSEKQREQFVNIINNLPEAAMFSEIGDGGNDEENGKKTVFTEVETKVNEKIKASEGKMVYAEALTLVFTEDPALEARYTKAVDGE